MSRFPRKHAIGAGLVVLTAALFWLAGGLVNRWSETHPLLGDDLGQIMDEPDAFCAVHDFETFSRRVRDVESSDQQNAAPEAATLITSGFIRRAAGLEDTPEALRPAIRELATLVEDASRSHEYREAYDLATFLDRASAEHCG